MGPDANADLTVHNPRRKLDMHFLRLLVLNVLRIHVGLEIAA